MKANASLVSLFQVPLQCPGAPEIACGSRARPILLALEADPAISEAWVNRAGTMLAVVGSESSSRESRAKTVVPLFEETFERKGAATEIVGRARETELTSFFSGSSWYRSAQTLSLSREEADIISARLVRRIQSGVTLTDEKAKALKSGFAEVFKRRHSRETGALQPISQRWNPAKEQEWNDQLAQVAREHLDEAGMAAFHGAIAKGHRPEPGEK